MFSRADIFTLITTYRTFCISTRNASIIDLGILAMTCRIQVTSIGIRRSSSRESYGNGFRFAGVLSVSLLFMIIETKTVVLIPHKPACSEAMPPFITFTLSLVTHSRPPNAVSLQSFDRSAMYTSPEGASNEPQDVQFPSTHNMAFNNGLDASTFTNAIQPTEVMFLLNQIGSNASTFTFTYSIESDRTYLPHCQMLLTVTFNVGSNRTYLGILLDVERV
jgi:hypothetical protein